MGTLAAAALAVPLAAAAGPTPEEPYAAGPAGPPMATSGPAARAASPVVVAVVDTGLDTSHPEIRGSLWRNPREIAGNGVDDDRNGLVDDVHGADLVRSVGATTDDVGHGTHVGGLVLREARRAGKDVRLMGLKVNSRSWIDFGGVARAIRYAVDNGARVVNLSWDTRVRDAGVEAALAYASQRGVLVVAAAGNGRANNDLMPNFPASYAVTTLVAVAATCDGRTLAPFSNFGKLDVDIAAPGCDSLSAVPGGSAAMSGTSMAAATTTGVLASLLASRPAPSSAEARRALLEGALPAAALDEAVASGGVVDPARAAAALVQPDRRQPTPFERVTPAGSFSAQQTPSYYETITFAWRPSADSGLAGYRLVLDGAAVRGVSASTTSVALRVRPGQHTWSVVAYDRGSNETVAGPG
jgi:subtilisin family serine protease